MLNELLEYASDKSNSDYLKHAKEVFSAKAGQIFEDDTEIVHRMNTFLEWFIFDYRLEEGKPNTILNEYINSKRDSLTSEEMVLRMAVAKNVHSLFQVKSCRDDLITLKDVVSGKRYNVTGDDSLEKGDLLEKRIICFADGCFFSYTHCLHPQQALKLIEKQLVNFKKGGLTSDFLLSLQSKQLTWHRSRQIDIRNIYRF